MTTEELRDTLKRLELSQGALAKIFKLLGDTAAPTTIIRRVERWCQGVSAVPGEAAAFIEVLVRFPAVLAALKRELRQAREAPAAAEVE